VGKVCQFRELVLIRIALLLAAKARAAFTVPPLIAAPVSGNTFIEVALPFATNSIVPTGQYGKVALSPADATVANRDATEDSKTPAACVPPA
jgi:hypothetical protein